MEVQSGVTRSIIDRLHCSDILQDQIEGEICIIGSMIDGVHSSDIQRD